ncbi:MAG: hypothetical protein J6T99_07730 [Oscillospiraceae bacterium]|nr:hypothetical protein [Oscillospiraceae bacterium]
MSKAFHCDRCGGFFGFFNIRPESLAASIPKIIYKNRKMYLNDAFDHSREDIDLCPKCTALFDEWMEEPERLAKITDPLMKEDGV